MTTINTARRAFLRGRAVQVTHHVPWAVQGFEAVCDRCGECIGACEESILVIGDGGYPTVDARLGACSFCGGCVDACRPAALSRRVHPAWQIEPRFGDGCLSRRGVTCRSCAESCDRRAIRFSMQIGGRADPIVQGGSCNGCGACVAVCPTHAIQMENS